MSSETEKVYDEQVAPLLLQALNICKEHGLPIIAAVYYDGASEDQSGLTQWHPDGARSVPWYLMRKAWAARGNLDKLCIGLARETDPDTVQSVVIRMVQGGKS